MSRPEAQTAPSSKRFVKEVVKNYRVGIFAERILGKLGAPLPCNVVARSFSDYFLTVIQGDLVDKGANFDKVRNAYEETISKLADLSQEENDLPQLTAKQLVSRGEYMLIRLNPRFDSDAWYYQQQEKIHPGSTSVPPKSESIFD